MSSAPAVIVKKGGVLTTLISGIFGTLILLILCAAGLGFYSLHLIDRNMRDFFGPENKFVEALPRLGQAVPMLGDLFSDGRMPGYRPHLQISARLDRPTNPDGQARVIVEATNRGDHTVTLLTARIVLLDASGDPLAESRCFIAAPLTFPEDQWRGPLLPGATRRFCQPVAAPPQATGAELEITDLRVWVPQTAPTGSAPASPEAE
jgi:hypothetical protein